MKPLALTRSALGLVLAAAYAAPAKAAEATPSPTRLQVFKNGFAVASYDLKPQADTFTVMLPNRARHGSVWFTCPKDPSCVLTITSEKVRRKDAPNTLGNVKDLLKPGVGKVQLLMDDKGRLVEGEVAAVYTSSGEEGGQPTVVVLKGAGGRTLAVPAEDIREVYFDTLPSLPKQFKRPEYEDSPQPLKVTLKPGAAAGGVRLTTLEYGYTWAPTYLLELVDETTAHLQMKATLLNEGAVLNNTLVDLAVGWPNLAFSSQRDALHTHTSLSDYLEAMESSGGSPGYSNRRESVMAQRMTNAYAGEFNDDEPSRPTPGASAESREDLHLYYGKAVSQEPGARFTTTVFAESLKMEHKYVWDVPDISGQGHDTSAPRFLSHKLSLVNSAKAPLTTAPVAITQKGALVAQSTLDYTAAGGRVEVEVSRGLDFALKADDTVEMEKARDVVLGGRSRVRVPGQGVLKVRSLKNKPVKVVVKKLVYGQVEKFTAGGKKEERSPSYAYDNATTTLTWEKVLAPGEEWVLSYNYYKLQS